MPKMYEGQLVAAGYRFAIVVSRFNEFITSKLLDGALDVLGRHGVDVERDVEVAWVLGSWEIPLAAARFAKSGKFDAVICLGCIIRGDTPHYEHIAAEATKGIAHSMMESGVPIAFGVLTTDNIEQAIERAGTKAGNKGGEAAMSAIEMVNLLKQLPESRR
jgi:6,7-dimethyl-8-ribityllumazine synthase